MSQTPSFTIAYLLVSSTCAALCGVIAARRKLSWTHWSSMGFGFGPFALPFVLLAKPKVLEGAKS